MRAPDQLIGFAIRLARTAGLTISSGEILVKLLTRNDDAAKHGVLIPTEAYDFFPTLDIPDPSVNCTREFPAFVADNHSPRQLAYKYYKDYPERRITRLPAVLNDRAGRRIVIFLAGKTRTGETVYVIDAALEREGRRFDSLLELFFGPGLHVTAGMFTRQSLETSAAPFVIDGSLAELLQRFDEIKSRGWVNAMRGGDTGIGYTFESLIGIKENNLQIADFNGIEIKCKQRKAAESRGGKINLFQLGPTWTFGSNMRDRLTGLGTIDLEGLYSCYSQVTFRANNLGLRLSLNARIAKLIWKSIAIRSGTGFTLVWNSV